MSGELILANAQIVLDDAVMAGSVLVRDGLIAAVDSGASSLAEAVDFEGDYLLPGLVEAEMVGLDDRGRIEEGKRADFERVRLLDGLPVVMGVWRGGVR
jgi:alpha-D-ribose 1-methylphosphonate 5-triphosphate diphosphatase PhnM